MIGQPLQHINNLAKELGAKIRDEMQSKLFSYGDKDFLVCVFTGDDLAKVKEVIDKLAEERMKASMEKTKEKLGLKPVE
jgi:hypothetical protein